MIKPVVLPTDAVFAALLALLVLYCVRVAANPVLCERWKRVFSNAPAMASSVVLATLLAVAAADSIHYRTALPGSTPQQAVWSTRTQSLLDAALARITPGAERSYSAPFAIYDFEKTSQVVDGKPQRVRSRLRHAGAHIRTGGSQAGDVAARAAAGAACGLALSVLLWLGAAWRLARPGQPLASSLSDLLHGRTAMPWRAMLVTLSLLAVAAALAASLWPWYHILGTDRTGNDALASAVKSVRTAIVIGSLATLCMLPFAVTLGIAAGYFRGWVDDVIQYIYTTISSIPSVLLIAASVLMIQVFIDKNPGAWETGLERADVRLFALAAIIGMTGWSTLARLLRAETLRISQLDFVSAAVAFGVPHWRIMLRHVLPSVMHIVLIVAVLDFSGIVLYEAVLSYVGVGVDPVLSSFGTMINAGRTEMSRTPVIWWNLAAAFTFMLSIVLAANLFASAVRAAFDPRSGGSHAA